MIIDSQNRTCIANAPDPVYGVETIEPGDMVFANIAALVKGKSRVFSATIIRLDNYGALAAQETIRSGTISGIVKTLYARLQRKDYAESTIWRKMVTVYAGLAQRDAHKTGEDYDVSAILCKGEM